MTRNCILCDVEITDKNDTKEHIIPNAIGGRKKVSGFICNGCNNETGSKWEVELAKQLNPLSLLLGIKRERGKAPSQTFEMSSGQKIKLAHDGQMKSALPTYEETRIDGKVRIHMTARNEQEAKKRIKGIQKKYPEANINFEVNHRTQYPDEPINVNLSFGGLEVGRSLVKSALAVIHESNVDARCCEQAINYLKFDNAEPCFGYYYSADPIIDRPVGTPLHCVYVKGSDLDNSIVGYVELFGYQRMALCLSSNYQGEFFEACYAINPLDGTDLNVNLDLQFDLEQVDDCYNYKLIPEGSIQKALGYILDTAIKRDYERERDRVINGAVQFGFENCGATKGEDLTKEQYEKMCKLALEKMRPFMKSRTLR